VLAAPEPFLALSYRLRRLARRVPALRLLTRGGAHVVLVRLRTFPHSRLRCVLGWLTYVMAFTGRRMAHVRPRHGWPLPAGAVLVPLR
jgi:hypothetical protein